MATMQEIIDNVISETGRGDRESLITTYTQYAVRHAHSLAYFVKDLKAETLINTAADDLTVGTINLPDDCKRVIVLRPMSGGQYIPNLFMERLDIETATFSDSRGQAENTFYEIGDTVQYKCEYGVGQFNVAYIQKRDLSSLSTSTWITEYYSEDIEMLVKARLFTSLGDRERGNQLKEDWEISAVDLINDNQTISTD